MIRYNSDMSELSIDKEDFKEKAREKAKNNFRNGYNCAEAVFAALFELGEEELSTDTGFDSDVVKLATGLGGGIGDSGNTCGAITGGAMGLGLIYGYPDPSEPSLDDRIGEKGSYKIFNQLPDRFKEEFGTVRCSELLEEVDETYTKEHLRYCMNNIATKGAEIAAELILEQKEKGTESFEFKESIL